MTLRGLRGIEPEEGRWDFDGSCIRLLQREADSPISGPDLWNGRRIWPLYGGQETFSLGVFQYVSKAKGDGLKRSKVNHRVGGNFANPRDAFQDASVLCEKLEER